MTGRSLLRRLLRNPQLALRWGDPRRVPLGARPVMDAVAEMVAGSGDALEYRPDPDIDGGRSLVEWVARQAAAIGAEAEVEGHLAALTDAGLVVLTDEGGLALALPLAAAGPSSDRKAESNRRNSMFSPGPRPKGISDEAWAAVKAEKKARVLAQMRKQGTLALPIAGGREGEATGSQTRSHLRAVPEANPSVGLVGGLASTLASEPRAESAAAAAVIPDNSMKTAAAAALDVRADAGAGGDLASGEAKSEANAAKPNGLASVASDDAVALAREAGLQFRWDPEHVAAAGGIMQGFLDAGYAPSMVRSAIADKRGAECRGARYLTKPLARLFPQVALGGGAPAVPATEALPADHPAVAGEPAWAALAPRARRDVSAVLRILDMPESFERWRLLDAQRVTNRAALDRVGVVLPVVWEIIEAGWRPKQAAG